MKFLPGILGLAFLLVLFTACGGGSSSDGTTSSVSGNCADSSGLCLLNCNLGCSTSGCSVSDIAVNQTLIFQFNRELDPASVNGDSFSIKTSTGLTPAGKLTVSGQTVFFMPEIYEVGSQTFFGFEKGNTYTIHLAAGPTAATTIRSKAGNPLDRPLTCSVVASLDVLDLDEKAPEVSMIVPETVDNVDPNTSVVLKFSEYVLPSTVLDPLSITMKVAQGDPTTGVNVQLTRVLKSDQLQNSSEVSLFPNVPLPGAINVMITVNPAIRDLSGKTVKLTKFFFSTKNVPTTPVFITEDFTSTSMMKPSHTGARWGGGELACGYVGGTGVLGDFNHLIGSTKVGASYIFNTDNTQIPAKDTLDGVPKSITDGVYHYANFTIPKGVKVRFEGTKLPKIFVRGSVDIQGTLDLSGNSPTSYAAPQWTVKAYQGINGGFGGSGGGRGGKGGSTPGTNKSAAGLVGEDLGVPVGHPRKSQAAGTGGNGSREHPLNLNKALVKHDYSSFMSFQVSGNGGGGSHVTKGAVGSVTEIGSYKTTHGSPTSTSNVFAVLPLSTTIPIIDHALIGGSGGGGVGACCWGDFNSTTAVEWCNGNGGGGGGGAVAIRCGGDFNLNPIGMINVKGGRGGGYTSLSGLPVGGSGSGGTILLQVGRNVISSGTLDYRGGLAGASSDMYSLVRYNGAAGGNGYLRIESVPAPSPAGLGTTKPAVTAANVGLLTDRDAASGAESEWYSANKLFPKFHYYEIEAMVGSTKVVYTDNPSAPNPCVFGTTPVAFFIKGAQVDAGNIIPTTISRWVVNIKDMLDPTKNGMVPVPPQRFRWTVIMDKSLAGNQDIKVLKVSVVVSD